MRRERAARDGEHELAGQTARLRSLEEMDAARTAFGDGARMLLAGAHDAVGQHGALADYLDVDSRYERAVEAALGDLLQHVVVDQPRAGARRLRPGARPGRGPLRLHRHRRAGPERRHHAPTVPAGAVRLSDVVRVTGPFAHSLRVVIGDAVIVPTLEDAAALAASVELPVVTIDGDVYRGAHVVSGGSRTEARGILATKREIKDLREVVTAAVASLADSHGRDRRVRHRHRGGRRRRCRRRSATPTVTRRRSSPPRPTCSAPRPTRRGVGQRAELVATEARGAREAIDGLDARQAEAQASIGRLADERVTPRRGPGRRAAAARRRPRRGADASASAPPRRARSTPGWPSGRWPPRPRSCGSRKRPASCSNAPTRAAATAS